MSYNNIQARSELRFWRGAEVDKVQNPKQLCVINLGKVKKICQFLTTLEKICNFSGARRPKLRFLRIFWRLRLKFKGSYASAGGASEKLWNILQESGIFMHLEEKTAQIVDLFARLGWCWSTLSTPPPSLRACDLRNTLNFRTLKFSLKCRENRKILVCALGALKRVYFVFGAPKMFRLF